MKWDSFFVNHQTHNVTQAGVILAVSALASRLLGVARDWLLATTFGAGSELDIYFTAFKVPDLVYNILILGGVSVAFLPIFSEYFAKDKNGAWKFTSNCLNIFFILLILLSIILFILTPFLVRMIAPGFNQYQTEKTIFLTRFMFLSPIFFGLSAVFSGVLQYFDRFLVYSFAPVFYNLSIIFGIAFLTPRFGILGVVMGVITGAFLHLMIQVPAAVSCGFSHRNIFDINSAGIRKVFLLMIPRTFGVSASQINLMVINAVASTLAVGSISVFNFANNIQYFPIGIIGASFAMAAFPTLSRKWVENQKQDFLHGFISVAKQVFYITVPVSFLMFILRNEIVVLLLRHGQFSSYASALTAASLGLFCLGIFASALIPLFFRAFFAIQDTKTPTIIAVISVALNVGLSIFFTKGIQEGYLFRDFLISVFSLENVDGVAVLGLSLAVAISGFVQLVMLMLSFRKRMDGMAIKGVWGSSAKVITASLLMAILTFYVAGGVNGVVDEKTFSGAFVKILVSFTIGAIIYILATLVLGSTEIDNIKRFFFRKRAQ